jgi:hypothetical protein
MMKTNLRVSDMTVTKASLTDMIGYSVMTASDTRSALMLSGVRACVALFKYQTAAEQATNDTRLDNGEGFTSADALSGSLTAKYYLKHKTLQGWQVDRWTKLNKRGDMRIAKYWAQLARAAEEKAAIKTAG